MGKEIERKWLLKQLPQADYSYSLEIKQIYLVPDKKGNLRLRCQRKEGRKRRYFLTRKSGNGLVRKEDEVEINKRVYNTLARFSPYCIINKERKIVHWADASDKKYKLEIDVFEDLEGLILLECEFKSVEEAEAFALPEIFALAAVREVTDEPSYSNANMARFGKPNH